jgi:hypothetical protein
MVCYSYTQHLQQYQNQGLHFKAFKASGHQRGQCGSMRALRPANLPKTEPLGIPPRHRERQFLTAIQMLLIYVVFYEHYPCAGP